MAEMIREDQIQRRSRSGLVLIVPAGIVPPAAACYLVSGQTEQKEVFLSRFLRHLDRRSIPRSDSQRAIHHELHISGPARLVSGRRDLFRYVACGNQSLGQSHTVVWDEHNLESLAHGWVRVSVRPHFVDEADY